MGVQGPGRWRWRRQRGVPRRAVPRARGAGCARA